jgi:CarD family transcriptional regulator
MFKIGDLIVYGNNGVCRVIDIGTLDSKCALKDKVYYTIEPFYNSGTKIYTPVDNDKIMMRPIISKEDALELIDNIKDMGELGISDEKSRESDYKETIKKCDCKELVKMIKTIYLRKQSRIKEGKKVTSSDAKYFRIAEDSLFGELAVSLGMDKEETREYVINKIA